MLATLISRSPDLQRLQNEYYELEIRSGAGGVHLLIHNVPYVNSQRKVLWGTLVTPLTLNNDATVIPLINNHQTWFIGECPCHCDGSEMSEIKLDSVERDLGNAIVVNHGFSSKPLNGAQKVDYTDYYAKMTTYINIISAPAYSLQPEVKAQKIKVIDNADDTSVFHYADTSTSRAGIGAMSSKLVIQKVAIIGLGGTGSYILDLVAKTHVQEIHLFDGDAFCQHNAFRAPGAPSIDELNNLSKVEYFVNIYSKMRRGIISHHEYITAANTEQLAGFNFVFICVDKPAVRKLIIDALHDSRVPFIDVGMDVQMFRQDSLMGQCRTTLSTPQKNDHIAERVSFREARANDLYASNIQVADLNALNATLAVIKWKKYYGFYLDNINEHNSIYTINSHSLTKDARV